MKISREKLRREAQATGFRPEVLEKVFHLLTLLEGFNRHPFLKERLALKGGTALNLFLFNVPRLSVDIDRRKLRLGFVVYGAMNRKDWRTVRVDDVGCDRRELENQLTPVVRSDFLGANKPSDWAQQMIGGCRRGLEAVLPLTKEEMSFLDALLERGRIEPERVTSDPDMMARISKHPLLIWKAQSVRKHKGIE